MKSGTDTSKVWNQSNKIMTKKEVENQIEWSKKIKEKRKKLIQKKKNKMSKEELINLKNKITRELCDRQRQIRTIGYVSSRTIFNINRWNNQYKEITGKTIALVNGNPMELITK